MKRVRVFKWKLGKQEKIKRKDEITLIDKIPMIKV